LDNYLVALPRASGRDSSEEPRHTVSNPAGNIGGALILRRKGPKLGNEDLEDEKEIGRWKERFSRRSVSCEAKTPSSPGEDLGTYLSSRGRRGRWKEQQTLGW